MFAKMIVIYLIVLLSFTGENEAASNWKCVPSDKVAIDQLVAQIMTYNWNGRNFPRNQAELRSYCREMAMLTRADDYKRQCLNGQSKHFVALFLYSLRQSFNSYCKHPSSRKTIEFYKSADCMNSASKFYGKCRSIYSEILQVIESTTDFDSKQKLPQLCCGYFKSLECIREKTTSKRGCKASDAETMIDFLNGVYEDAINALCRDYNEDSNKCEQVKLVKTKEGKNVTDSNRPSFFNQAVNVFTNL